MTITGLRFLKRYIARCACNMLPGGAFSSLRCAIWRVAGVNVGPGCNLYHDISIWAQHVSIGAGSYIGPTTMLAGNTITIGRNCDISAGVVIHSGSHDLGPASRRAGNLRDGAILIGDGVWVGTHATIISGVSIGSGTVVGAGSVVTKPIAPNSLCVGVPARVIRTLEN